MANKTPHIKFDVMQKDRYVCTLAMPLGIEHLKGFDGDDAIFNFTQGDFRKVVERERPSLKGKDFYCEIVTKQTRDLWRR